jgi:hypothetical protein
MPQYQNKIMGLIGTLLYFYYFEGNYNSENPLAFPEMSGLLRNFWNSLCI